MTYTKPPRSALSLPRILCLHGGGTNKEIFQAQCRTFTRLLPSFRLVFADAPFFCDAGPGVVPVYEDYGPFRRWLRFRPEHGEIDDETAISEIFDAVEQAKSADKGTGEWVGLMGFSQGAKMAASLAYDEQWRGKSTYKFAVLMAGRAPLVSLCEGTRDPALATAGGKWAESHVFEGESSHVLRLPTVHVHGLQDQGLELHRDLARRYCDEGTRRVFEWEGNHRVPFKTMDVQPIVDEIVRIARKQGVDVPEV